MLENSPSRHGLWILWGAGLLLGAKTLWLPSFSLLSFPAGTCPLKALTGIPCPGCGTTRSLMAMLHGNFGAAFAMNPLGSATILLALPMVVWLVTVPQLRACLGSFTARHPSVRVALIGMAITLIAGNWIYILIRRFGYGVGY